MSRFAERISCAQVLLTEDAWHNVSGNMYAAGFPAICQLGLYKVYGCKEPMWVYQVNPFFPCTPAIDFCKAFDFYNDRDNHRRCLMCQTSFKLAGYGSVSMLFFGTALAGIPH